MARYAIPSDKALGVAMKDIKALGKTLGPEPGARRGAVGHRRLRGAHARRRSSATLARLTAAQMDRWCREFDNWAFCDAMSFNLFDRTPHAWAKVDRVERADKEFEKRTAFALLWSLSVHDKARRQRRVRQRPRADRTRSRRRSSLRQEGGEHGAARDRQAQHSAQCRRGGSARAAWRARRIRRAAGSARMRCAS